MRRTIAAALAVSCLAVAAPCSAQHPVEAGEADCSTPRRALLTWLANLQAGREHPALAAQCFEWDAARVEDDAQRVDVARRLKRVLDARGLYVEMDEISDEEAPADTTRVAPFPNNLPAFYLVRASGGWAVSAESIRRVPVWYDETFAVDVDHLVDDLPSWMREEVLGAMWWQWLALLALVLIALLLRYVITWVVATQGTRFLARVAKRLSQTHVRRAASPIGTVAMALLAAQAFPLLRFGVDVNRIAHFGLRVAAAVSSVLIVYRFVDVLGDIMARRAESTETKLDDQLVPLVRKSLKVVTVLLGLIFVLQNMEVDVASLVAGVSLGGLAFTLAARETVANLFGSLSIFADQPFQVGDWVVMQGVEGVVEEVGMRSTRVRTFYRSLVSIPNAKVADGIIDNYGSRDSRRTNIKLGVQYDTTPEQMEAFCDGIRAILAASPKVKKDAYHVCFSGFGESGLDVLVYFFFVVDAWPDELRQRHIVYLEILRLAAELGVQFAFPTRTLHLATRAKESEVSLPHVPSTETMTATVLGFGPGGALGRPAGQSITHGFYAGATPGDASAASTQGADPDADRSDSRT